MARTIMDRVLTGFSVWHFLPRQGETVEVVQRQGHWLQIEWLSVGSYVEGWVAVFEPNTKARVMRQVGITSQ